jgi:hypothetical protein
MSDELNLKITALDAGNGYVLLARGTYKDSEGSAQRAEFHEHRATEALTKARLAQLWDAWAALVDAE